MWPHVEIAADSWRGAEVLHMADAQQTVRGYINDLMAVQRHVADAMERHASEKDLARVAGGTEATRSAVALIRQSSKRFEQRLAALGGPGAVGQLKEAVTTVTGFLAGVYGQARPETASRMLRDDATALNFLMVCAGMLHATAVALRDMETAGLTNELLRDLPPVLMKVNDLVPRAVLVNLADEHPVDRGADEAAVREIHAAWRGASSKDAGAGL